MKIDKKQIFIPFAILTFMCHCSSIKKISCPEEFKLKMTFSFPVKNEDSTSFFYEHFSYKAKMGKYIIYELPYRVSLEKIYTLQDSSKLVYDSMKTEFFIHDTISPDGYNFKNCYDLVGTRFQKDSFLKNKSQLIFDDLKIAEPEEKKVLSKSIINNDGEIIHRFIVKNSSIDSAYYYYSKDIVIPVSFSLKLDSINNAKLFQIKYFYKPEIFNLPGLNYALLKIENVPFLNRREIGSMIKKIESE